MVGKNLNLKEHKRNKIFVMKTYATDAGNLVFRFDKSTQKKYIQKILKFQTNWLPGLPPRLKDEIVHLLFYMNASEIGNCDKFNEIKAMYHKRPNK